MHWNQYASPRQQREWSRLQAENRAKETQEYRVDVAENIRPATASKVAMNIAEKVRDCLDTKWHGSKHEVVVRVLFPPTPESHTLIRVTKMRPWTTDSIRLADNVVKDVVGSATPVDVREKSDDAAWKGEGVYVGTAVDESWRSAFGMAGGKPWGSSERT